MKLAKIFSSFSNVRPLIIGDLMMDHYVWGQVSRISPEAPVPVVHKQKTYFRLGGAGNVALNLIGLGAKPSLCAVVGDDLHGKQLLNRLSSDRIATESILVDAHRPTTVKSRIMAGHQHIVRVDDEVDYELHMEEQEKLWEKIKKALPATSVVIFQDYDKGLISPSLIADTIALAKANDIPVVVDPKKRNFLNYRHVTLFKPNLKELREGLGMNIEAGNTDQLSQAVDRLWETIRPEQMLVTLSDKGVYLQTAQGKIYVSAHSREIADVSGAGDTVISIAALCVALRLPPAILAELSNLAGGLVCQHIGVVPIDKNELYQEALHHLPWD